VGTAYELPIHPRQAASARGEQRFFYLDPPLKDEDYGFSDGAEHQWVIVSAVTTPSRYGGGPETFIFPADASGQLTSYGNLPGSYQGGLDHLKALALAGYEDVFDGTTVAPVLAAQRIALAQAPWDTKAAHTITEETNRYGQGDGAPGTSGYNSFLD
jgi:hypothetical protein